MNVETPARYEFVERLYAAYNGREEAALVAMLCPDVDWPDGAGRLHGHAAVVDYWTRQWKRTLTHDKVVEIVDLGPDRIAVALSQVVRDLDRSVLSTGAFEHILTFRDGLVARLDLRELRPGKEERAMTEPDAMLRRLYEGFNRRDIPAVLALLAEQVDWANGMDGGHVHGREAVREYWTKQWAAIQPRVDPVRVTEQPDGRTAVEVHQVVHDLEGKLLLDESVRHVFRIEGGLVTRFDIENAGGLSAISHDRG